MVHIKILIMNTNGFDIYYTHKDTDDIYDLNGFDIKGIHRDINTFK